MLSVTEAGPYDRSLEMDYDDEVAFHAAPLAARAARDNDERPFTDCVSFIHPHDPYLAAARIRRASTRQHRSAGRALYPGGEARAVQPAACTMLYDRDEYTVTDEHVRAARHGYYAMITYATG